MSYKSERVKAWRQRTKQRMIDSMGSKCQCCGYNICEAAMSFHHLDPSQKDFGMGSIRANPKSWPKIVEELKKCILVCNNCHAEIHQGLRQVPEHYQTFDDNFLSFKKIAKKDICPGCQGEKDVINKYCSRSCATKNSRKVDWDNIDLLDLMNKHTIGELETMLGVSNGAIYKRRKKLQKMAGQDTK